MIITRVTDYLKERRRASLTDMAHELETTPEALRDMLRILERKGRVRRLPSGTACGGGCSKCSPETIEIYETTAENPAQAVTFSQKLSL